MATTSYSGIGRYNYKLLPLSLSSITRCPCHSSPSKALVPARPRVVRLNFVFDGRKGVLRLGRDCGLPRRRVITAVARVEPEQLGEENANQVLSIWIWDCNKFWIFFFFFAEFNFNLCLFVWLFSEFACKFHIVLVNLLVT